jgi:hypothetical protein
VTNIRRLFRDKPSKSRRTVTTATIAIGEREWRENPQGSQCVREKKKGRTRERAGLFLTW